MRIKPYFLHIVLVCIGLLLLCNGYSQKNYFPEPGDTLYYIVDRNPRDVSIDDENRHATWDISMAKAPFLRPVVPVDPKSVEGNLHFQEADYALKMEDQTIHFFKREGRELYMLGQYGFFIYKEFVPAVVKFDYPFIVNYPSAQHGQEWEYQSQATIEFSTSNLQPASISRLPVKADSVKVIMSIDRVTMRDAEGQLKYEIIYDDVTRHFTIEQYRYRVLLRVGEKPWQDFSGYVDAAELFGPVIRYRYDFLNEDFGVPVASVWVNPFSRKTGKVKYWVRSYLDRFKKADQGTDPDIYAFPNPAIGYVNIELNNLKPGRYKVALYNFLAQEIYQTPVEVNSDETVRINVTEYDKGPYLYALIDQYGRRIITKRLTILKP